MERRATKIAKKKAKPSSKKPASTVTAAPSSTQPSKASSFPVTFIVLLGLMSYQSAISSKKEIKPSPFVVIVFALLAAVTAMMAQATMLTSYKHERFIVMALTSVFFFALSLGWLKFMY